MDINRNNYEAFLLDLLEGRLSVVEERELKEFLKHHPEHVVDLPDIDLVSLEKPRLNYPLRDQLKKELPTADTRISEANFDMFSIARMEGDLSSQQEEEHRYLVSVDDRKREEWSDWQKTRLVPEQILYHGKKRLKRKKAGQVRVIWLSAVSAAAVVALLFVLLRVDPLVPGPELSQANPDESLTSQEPSVAISQAPVTVPVEEAVVPPEVVSLAAPEKETLAISDKEVLKTPEEEAPLLAMEIKPRPLRIAESMNTSSAMVALSSSDRIEPLPVNPVSSNLASLSVAQIAELDRKKLIDDFAEENNISLLSVANAGIKGINKITGSEITLLASRDEEGDVSGFRLKSKRFSVTRPLARQD